MESSEALATFLWLESKTTIQTNRTSDILPWLTVGNAKIIRSLGFEVTKKMARELCGGGA